jgi:hypothetical protein
MTFSAHEIRQGLRDGSLAFCLPAAHENFTSAFLEEFSERVLKQHWCDVAGRSHLRITALLSHGDSEEDLAATIQNEYGADIQDLPRLPFWEVVRRCARSEPGAHS